MTEDERSNPTSTPKPGADADSAADANSAPSVSSDANSTADADTGSNANAEPDSDRHPERPSAADPEHGATADPEAASDWREENAAIRERLGLPAYDPPRFLDGAAVHDVLADLEADRDRSVRIIGVDTDFPDDLEVRVGGRTLFPIGRHRNEDGNTVYEMTADTFRSAVAAALDGERSGDPARARSGTSAEPADEEEP